MSGETPQPAPEGEPQDPSAFGETTATGPQDGPAGAVPYSRFKQVNDERKELKARIEALEAQRSIAPEVPQGQGLTASQYADQEIARWRKEGEKRFEEGDYSGGMEATQQIARLASLQTGNELMQQAQQQQTQLEQARTFNLQKQQYLDRMSTEFPFMADSASALRQEVVQEWENTPHFKSSPSGEYDAAVRVAFRHGLSGGKAPSTPPPALEIGSGPRPSPEAKQAGDLDKLKDMGLGGDDQALLQYLESQQPWRKPTD